LEKSVTPSDQTTSESNQPVDGSYVLDKNKQKLFIESDASYEQATSILSMVSRGLAVKTGGVFSLGINGEGFPVLEVDKVASNGKSLDEILKVLPQEARDFLTGREGDESGNPLSPDYKIALPPLGHVLNPPEIDPHAHKVTKQIALAHKYLPNLNEDVGRGSQGNAVGGRDVMWFTQRSVVSDGTASERGVPQHIEHTEGDVAAMHAAEIWAQAVESGLIEREVPQVAA